MIMRSSGCNIFSVITSRLESSVVMRPPHSLGNDAFDIYSCGTSVPDALVVCSLFYWAWWVSLSLLLSSMADSVTTAIYPPDSTRCTIDQTVDVTWRWHKARHMKKKNVISLIWMTWTSSVSHLAKSSPRHRLLQTEKGLNLKGTWPFP